MSTPVARASAAMAAPVCCAISRIPRGRQIDRRGKDRSRVESVQALLNEKSGNAETIVRDHPVLDGVRLLRRGIEIVNAADAEISPESLRFLRQKDGIGCHMILANALVL